MNTSSRFIIDTIKSWENKFPGIHVKYAFEEDTCFHVIEVRPEEIHEGSEDFANEEALLWESFFEKFPDEDILITAPSVCNDMTNLIYETGVIIGSVNVSQISKYDSYPVLSYTDLIGLASIITEKSILKKRERYTYDSVDEVSWEESKEFALAA